MTNQGYSRGAVVAGAVFVVIGAVFLLEEVGVLDIDLGYLLPVLLIALGVAVLLSGRRRPPEAGPSRAPAGEPEPAWAGEHPGERDVTERPEDRTAETVWMRERVTDRPAGGTMVEEPTVTLEPRAAASREPDAPHGGEPGAITPEEEEQADRERAD
jgi:hypothetical protein